MVKKPGQEKSIQQLRQEVAFSRDRVVRDLAGMRYELDFPLKFRKSFQRQTVIWVGAAVVIGIAVVLLPARTKKVTSEPRKRKDPREEILGAGLALGALKVAAVLLRPVVLKFVVGKLGEIASGAKRRG